MTKCKTFVCVSFKYHGKASLYLSPHSNPGGADLLTLGRQRGARKSELLLPSAVSQGFILSATRPLYLIFSLVFRLRCVRRNFPCPQCGVSAKDGTWRIRLPSTWSFAKRARHTSRTWWTSFGKTVHLFGSCPSSSLACSQSCAFAGRVSNRAPAIGGVHEPPPSINGLTSFSDRSGRRAMCRVPAPRPSADFLRCHG